MADDIVTRLRDVTEMNWDGDEVTEPLCEEAADEIERLRAIGDRLAEQVMVLLGPLSTDADPATVERHQQVRAGALAEWAEARRG